MKMQSQAVLHGIKSSKGDYEGRGYDSTTFHLSVDMGSSSNGESIGVVTRPFKFGDSTEIEKWAHLGAHMGSGKPVPVKCDFDVVASSDGVKLTLLGIEPATQAKPVSAQV